jgi:hypothetical protein
MTIIARVCAVAMLLAASAPAHAADNAGIERLATCQDSWLDWKTSAPAQLRAFADRFQAEFGHNDNDAFFVPLSSQTVAGLPLVQVFPDSVGMGVGFSVVVNASFETTKASLQQRLGRSLARCEPPSDNMRTCELKIAEKRTIVLMAEENAKSTKTLFGCYYLYEK